jgi:hypothetical protein
MEAGTAEAGGINMTDFGLWSVPGVPHKGWTCVDMIDQEDDLITCQMCQKAEVRYVHEMRHPEFPQTLWVGCVCAARMESEYAVVREDEFKKRLRSPERWAQIDVCDQVLGRKPGPDDRQFVERVREKLATTRCKLKWYEKERMAALEQGKKWQEWHEWHAPVRGHSPETLSWIAGADELLAAPGLQEHERKFVEDLKKRLVKREDFEPSPKQTNWFRKLYLKHVQRKEKVA